MSSDWREHGPEAARRSFFAWSVRNADASQQDAFEAGFARGARWAIQTTGALSPAVTSLIELVEWLREQEPVA